VLRPLLEKFDELEDLLLNHRHQLAQNTGVPFVRLVYEPEQQVRCQQLTRSLARTLEQKGVPVETVSCRGVIFTYYEETGRLERLFELEAAEGDRLDEYITKRARTALDDRILRAAERLGEDGVILLTETTFVYPYVSLSSVLEDCTNCIAPPMALVVFYPGDVDIDKRLLFLGRRPSGYYRTRDLI
jgi:hypothetical protein